MTLDQQLAILQAAKDGKRVQILDEEEDESGDLIEVWLDIKPNHRFDFTRTYRICEPKKLEPWSTIEQIPFKQGVLWLKDSEDVMYLVTSVFIGLGSVHLAIGDDAHHASALFNNDWLYADLSPKNSTLATCKWLPCGIEVEE